MIEIHNRPSFSEANRPGPSPEPILLSPVGERIPLPSGVVIERPHPLVIASLQAQDPRVHYFPTDFDSFKRNDDCYSIKYLEDLYNKSVSSKIGYRVREDFPKGKLWGRGTVATVTSPLAIPYWKRDSSFGTDTSLPLTSVNAILASGSDDGGDSAAVGSISEAGRLNSNTEVWLGFHYRRVSRKLSAEQSDQIFPVLLVYKRRAFAHNPRFRFNELTGDPTKRVAALYITDKVSVPDGLHKL